MSYNTVRSCGCSSATFWRHEHAKRSSILTETKEWGKKATLSLLDSFWSAHNWINYYLCLTPFFWVCKSALPFIAWEWALSPFLLTIKRTASQLGKTSKVPCPKVSTEVQLLVVPQHWWAERAHNTPEHHRITKAIRSLRSCLWLF